VPFGTDIFAQYGDEQALPVVGNFDPPTGVFPLLTNTNARNHFDVNDDFIVSPIDALLVINALSSSDTVSDPAAEPFYVDVNADGHVSPLDALMVISHLDNLAAARAPKSALAASVLVAPTTLANTSVQPTTVEPTLADALYVNLDPHGSYEQDGGVTELQRDSTVLALAGHHRFVRSNLESASEGELQSALADDDLRLDVDEQLLELLATDRLPRKS
jgi:hypothetical protein